MKLSKIDKGNRRRKIRRIPDDLDNRLVKGQYCYIKEFPVTELQNSPQQWWDLDDTLSSMVRNCDYRLVDIARSHKKMNNWFLWKPETVFSIDQEGIHAPLGMVHKYGIVHPGNERIIIARYLQFDHVSLFTKKSLCKSDTVITQMITNLDDLISIFGPKISVYVTNYGSEDRDNLEVYYFKSGKMDYNSKDDVSLLGEQERSTSECDDLMKYLLENGLEVVYNGEQKVRTQGIFTTKFVNNPSNSTYIVLHDNDLHNLDFWELFFHFDYKRRHKICHSKKIEIINNYNIDSKVYNSTLYKTLIRSRIS